MSRSAGAAAKLPESERKKLAVQALAGSETIGELSARPGVSRNSSLVENLKSLLRNYFTRRRHLGNSYLDLLRFFLNHRRFLRFLRFLRSRRAERNGRSPRELMTGQDHPHWLTLLGLGPLQP